MDQNYLQRALSRFMEFYHPVDDISQATHLFSTSEIYSAMAGLNPGAEIQKEEIFNLLEEAGYKWQPDPDKMSFSLKWMVSRVL